jgi:hypothetical protein
VAACTVGFSPSSFVGRVALCACAVVSYCACAVGSYIPCEVGSYCACSLGSYCGSTVGSYFACAVKSYCDMPSVLAAFHPSHLDIGRVSRCACTVEAIAPAQCVYGFSPSSFGGRSGKLLLMRSVLVAFHPPHLQLLGMHSGNYCACAMCLWLFHPPHLGVGRVRCCACAVWWWLFTLLICRVGKILRMGSVVLL